MSERFYMIPESLFKCVVSHVCVVFRVVYAACTDGCLVYYIFAHALVFVVDIFPYSCTITTGCANDLWLALPNYVCIVF